MDAKKLGQEQAFPVPAPFWSAAHEQLMYAGEGMTLRQAFAMHAPEPHPSWDYEDAEHEAALKAAKQDEDASMPTDPQKRKDCEDWRRDGTYDLPDEPEFQAFEKAWEKRKDLEARRNYPIKSKAAWAVAYADALLAELAKED